MKKLNASELGLNRCVYRALIPRPPRRVSSGKRVPWRFWKKGIIERNFTLKEKDRRERERGLIRVGSRVNQNDDIAANGCE